MLQFQNYNIVFQEIPEEITLAINISGCPNRCKGCHSPHLWDNIGDLLDINVLEKLVNRYKEAITCVCFMGGDSDPKEVERLATHIRAISKGAIKTAWYSGRQCLPESCSIIKFDYIKLGEYVQDLGGLSSPKTNQRMYQIQQGVMVDITHLFKK